MVACAVALLAARILLIAKRFCLFDLLLLKRLQIVITRYVHKFNSHTIKSLCIVIKTTRD